MTTLCPPLPERRVHQALTASAEKRLFEHLARHAPGWLTSDQLTALGLFGQLAAGAAFALSRLHRNWLLVCCVMLVVNWLGDSLDGTLARVRRRQRPRYGFYLDHICDLFGSIALMAGIALSGLAHGWVCAGLLANGLAIVVCSTANFLLASIWIFRPAPRPIKPCCPPRFAHPPCLLQEPTPPA